MTGATREMVVESVRVHMLSSQHVVILREAGEARYLPIWIGSWEAQSIAMKLQGVETERPLTHDLLATILGDLGVSVRRILVSDLADETFRARIVLVQGGSDFEIDARPSDAIALAVRVGAPIFATEAVLDRAGVIPEADEEERLSVFREFVNSLDPGSGEGSGPGGTTFGSEPFGPAPADDPRPDDRPLDDRLGDGDGDEDDR
ncbi:MAG: bifunctional nuclease family protein [Candidatus Limnocylindrales bacterium]